MAERLKKMDFTEEEVRKANPIEMTLRNLSHQMGFKLTEDMIGFVERKAKTETKPEIIKKAFEYLAKKEPEAAIRWEIQYYQEKRHVYIPPKILQEAGDIARHDGSYGRAAQYLANYAKKPQKFTMPKDSMDIVLGVHSTTTQYLPENKRDHVETLVKDAIRLAKAGKKEGSENLYREAYRAAYDPMYKGPEEIEMKRPIRLAAK
ncbi:MAG: hypothetical protein ABII22_02375 [Candidatus Micrarchaeota archaeon]